MQLFSIRSRRFRPRLSAPALALTLAGAMDAQGAGALASEQLAPALQEEDHASAHGAPSLFSPRHRPWRHHVYQRDSIPTL